MANTNAMNMAWNGMDWIGMVVCAYRNETRKAIACTSFPHGMMLEKETLFFLQAVCPA